MTTVCTQNWASMMDFYCRILGLETDNRDFRFIVALKGLNSQICLQKVEHRDEEEVIGRLEFKTDEAGFDQLLQNRESTPFEIRSNAHSMELEICDPDGNRIEIHQELVAQAA